MKLLLEFVFIILCTAKVNEAQNVRRSSNSVCRINEWQCTNGQCINFEDRCNGQVDCIDGSDETSSACILITCPNYGFRCSYGACLSRSVECNGIQDCADNSDEITLNCPGIVESLAPKGDCVGFQYKCQSGECIGEELACDGKRHCTDGSDETEQLCLRAYCPAYAFRCKYGACISAFRKCDGVADCVDGSDEAAYLCGSIQASQLPVIYSRAETVGVETCQLDYVPMNGHVLYADNENLELRLGDKVDVTKAIVYRCNAGFVIIGNSTNQCTNGQWFSELPTCSSFCDGVKITGITIETQCMYDGKPIECDGKLLPGTQAKISCRYGYQKPYGIDSDTLECMSNSKWNDTPFRCIEECGMMQSTSEQMDTYYPWVASIYYRGPSLSVRAEPLCAGSILSAKIIISAANCFWNVSSDTFVSESSFIVGVGKIYSNYDAFEPYAPAFFDVSKIDYVPEFGSRPKLFYSDVAILILRDFIIYTPYIRPICFDPNLIRFEREIPINSTGWVTTFLGQSSRPYILRRSQTINYHVCREMLMESIQRFLTNDKFCGIVATNDGGHLCKGDNGGGVVFLRKDGTELRYYLRGIIFLSYLNEERCEMSSNLISTNLQIYSKMIMQSIFQNPL